MENKKQKTAVEYLEERLNLSLGNELKSLRGFFVIAKEMEKSQIEKAIYEKHEQSHTQHYTAEDHSDAVNAHMKESKKHADDVKWYQKVEENTGNEVSDRRSAQDKQNEHKKKQDHHSSMAELHSNAMNSKLETELAVTKGWAYNALERYHKEKKDWGEADYGETSAAYSAVAELENQIKSLKWVIEG